MAFLQHIDSQLSLNEAAPGPLQRYDHDWGGAREREKSRSLTVRVEKIVRGIRRLFGGKSRETPDWGCLVMCVDSPVGASFLGLAIVAMKCRFQRLPNWFVSSL
jgi:hypothetical protein